MWPFKNRIYKLFNINFFKNEESDKMSAESTHVQKTSEGESTNYYLYNYYFRYYIVGGYYFVIIIMKISPNQVLLHSWYLID